MGKPSIGDAVTVAAEKAKKREMEELTVLQKDSKESIYYLIFSETESDGLNINE